MKLSKFNMPIQFKNKTLCIYNTLSDSLTFLDENTWNQIQANTDNIEDNKLVSLLNTQGILLTNDIDEMEIYRFRTGKQRYKNPQTHIFLTLTDACNCCCPYCFEKKQTNTGNMKRADFNIINSFIAEQIKINNSRYLHIDFFGGEPFLCEDIIFYEMDELLKLAQYMKTELSIQFYTNGTVKFQRGFAALQKYPIKNILITLDGIKSVHDKMRPLINGKSSYDQIISNSKELLSLNIPVSIRINFDNESYKSIPLLLSELESNGMKKVPIQFYPIQSMSHSCADYSNAVSVKELEKIMPVLWEYAIGNNFNVPLKPNVANIYCSAFCSSTFMINPNLDIHKCALLQCDDKYKIANLKEKITVNDGSYYYKWMNRDASMQKKCADCISLPVCSGGCGGTGTFKSGTHLLPNCYEFAPNILEKRIYFYILSKYTKKVKDSINKQENYMVLEEAKYKNIWW
jgi:uncharacterized protein